MAKKKRPCVKQMDLWTHFRELAAAYDQLPADNKHGEQLPVTTRRPERRPSERAQIALIRNWLLNDYLAAYCRSLAATRIFRRCCWIDGLGLDGRSARMPEGAAEPEQEPGGKRRKKEPLPPVLQPLAALGEELAREARPI